MAIKIPKNQEEPFASLLGLSDAEAEGLLEALRGAEPALTLEGVVAQVLNRINTPVRNLRGIIAVLTSLLITRDRNDLSTEQVIDEALDAAESERLGPFAQGQPNRDALRQRLIALLSLEKPLLVTSRAIDVMSSHKNVFESARVLTDIRYVFSSPVSVEPVAGLIIHNLEINTVTDGQPVSYYAALDNADLRKLQQVIERAIQKERALQDVILRSGYSYISAETD